MGRLKNTNIHIVDNNREVLQNEFQYYFRKGPREISAGTVITVLKAIEHIYIYVNTINTVPAEISRGPFRKSYRNSFCKTSLIPANFSSALASCVLKQF